MPSGWTRHLHPRQGRALPWLDARPRSTAVSSRFLQALTVVAIHLAGSADTISAAEAYAAGASAEVCIGKPGRVSRPCCVRSVGVRGQRRGNGDLFVVPDDRAAIPPRGESCKHVVHVAGQIV